MRKHLGFGQFFFGHERKKNTIQTVVFFLILWLTCAKDRRPEYNKFL